MRKVKLYAAIKCDRIFLTQNLKKVQTELPACAGAWFYSGAIAAPPLPQTMPKEQSKKVRIAPNLYQRLLDEKPTYLSITAFTGIVIDKGLDACDTLIKPSAPEGPRPGGAECFISKEIDIDIKEEKKKKTKLPFTTKRLDPELIPAELQDCADQIIEFWAVKKGTRSEGAATRLFNKLEAMTPADRIKALNIATDSGWASVFPPRDQPRTQTAGNIRDTPTETAHPAGKVFTASDVIGGAFN